MATALDALKIARSLLNDDLALTWNDAILMPKLVQAHGELMTKLTLNGVAVVREETALILVTAGSLTLGTDQPTSMTEPIKMDELDPGADIAQATRMSKVEFIPNLDKTEGLRYWAWIDNQIRFLGSLVDREVHLYYIRSFTAPKTVNDVLPFPQSETYLGPRVAALTRVSDIKFASAYAAVNQIAEENLSRIVRATVKADQALPARRKPFSYVLRNRRRVAL